MRELISVIEESLGADRLSRLHNNEDDYQDFWIGVLEAFKRVDWDRDMIGFLITSGYGAIRNAKRSTWSVERYRYCPKCGKIFGYRTVECPDCKIETISDMRHTEYDTTPARTAPDQDLEMTIQDFVITLNGNAKYIAKRWMIDRADLKYQNHSKQIAFELGLSPARVAQIKKTIKAEFQFYINQ